MSRITQTVVNEFTDNMSLIRNTTDKNYKYKGKRKEHKIQNTMMKIV